MRQASFEEAFAEHVAGLQRRRGRDTMCRRLTVTTLIVLALLWAAKQFAFG